MHFPPPIYSYLNQLSSLSSQLWCWSTKGWLYLDKAPEFCYSEMSAKQVFGWTVTGLVIQVKIISPCIGRGSCMNICLCRCRSAGGGYTREYAHQGLNSNTSYMWGHHVPRATFPVLFSFYWVHVLLGFPDWSWTWNLSASVTHSWESQTWVNRPGSTSPTSISGFGK